MLSALILAAALLPQQPLFASPMDWSTVVDTTADPCTDFYQYACGNWMKQNPIPADYSRWSWFDGLGDFNRERLHGILNYAEEQVSSGTADANTQKIGDFYAACMDTVTINTKGLDGLKSDL